MHIAKRREFFLNAGSRLDGAVRYGDTANTGHLPEASVNGDDEWGIVQPFDFSDRFVQIHCMYRLVQCTEQMKTAVMMLLQMSAD
jgi:hypothetical protein